MSQGLEPESTGTIEHDNTPAGLLPSPNDVNPLADATHLSVDSAQTIKFDELGPMVVNSDGTLSRIANWSNMTPMERERTLRVIAARNKIRIADKQHQHPEENSNASPQSS